MLLKPKIPKVYLLGILFSVLFILGILSSIFWDRFGLNKNIAEWIWSAGQDFSELGLIFCVRALFKLAVYLQQEKQLLLEYKRYIKIFWWMSIFAFDLIIVSIVDSLFISPFVFSTPKFINLYIAAGLLLYKIFGIHKYIVKTLKYLTKKAIVGIVKIRILLGQIFKK